MLDDIKWKAKHKLNKIFKVERCSLLSASEYQSSSINQEFTDILCDLSCGKAKNSVYEYEAEKKRRTYHSKSPSRFSSISYHNNTLTYNNIPLPLCKPGTQPQGNPA